METKPLNKKYYKTSHGREPAREFINGLGKVQELVVDDGPGYRVYYAVVDEFTLILLLTAGDKKTQQKDIRTAESYLENYLKQVKEGKAKGASRGKK